LEPAEEVVNQLRAVVRWVLGITNDMESSDQTQAHLNDHPELVSQALWALLTRGGDRAVFLTNIDLPPGESSDDAFEHWLLEEACIVASPVNNRYVSFFFSFFVRKLTVILPLINKLKKF